MFTTSFDNTFKIFGTKCIINGQNTCSDWVPLRTMKGHENKVTSISVTRDLKRIITTSFDRCFKIWEAS